MHLEKWKEPEEEKAYVLPFIVMGSGCLSRLGKVILTTDTLNQQWDAIV